MFLVVFLLMEVPTRRKLSKCVYADSRKHHRPSRHTFRLVETWEGVYGRARGDVKGEACDHVCN